MKTITNNNGIYPLICISYLNLKYLWDIRFIFIIFYEKEVKVLNNFRNFK